MSTLDKIETTLYIQQGRLRLINISAPSITPQLTDHRYLLLYSKLISVLYMQKV